MKKLLFITMLLGALYSMECEDVNAEYGTNFNCDCNESTWEAYYNSDGHNMEGCWLYGAYLIWVDLIGADLSGACLEGAIGFTQTDYFGTPILEGCAFGGGDCSFEDTDEDGYDDMSFIAGAASVDANNDGLVDDFPSISIIDGDAIILMQESLEQYTDSGASCSDQEDGDISHQVEVSGDIVNMSSPGTYMIFYNCSDSDGNAAQTKHRTVFIIPPIIADENEDGFDDDGFMAGAQSGDVNLDGVFNIVDIVLGVEILLNGE